MSEEFSAAWLALREPADAAARAGALADQLVQALGATRAAGSRLAVIDLGAGTGANLRYAAPRLGGAQEWLCIERDPALLAAAAGLLSPAAPAGPDCRVQFQALDLATQMRHLPLPRGALLTASALLDLVCEAWLRELAQAAAGAAATVWFTLTYDGRSRCGPAEPEDEEIRELVNRHQLTDKGFGAALGPAAADVAERLFTQAGYRIRRAPSDWHIGPGQSALQCAVITGWAAAALQIAPQRADVVRDWLSRRLAHVAGGRSTLLVGHADLLGLP